MVKPCDGLCEKELRIPRIAAVRKLLLYPIQLLRLNVRRQFKVFHDKPVRNLHDLCKHRSGILINADVVSKAFTHLLNAVGSLQDWHKQCRLALHAHILLKASAHEDIEGLVCSAKLQIGFQCNRIICLH